MRSALLVLSLLVAVATPVSASPDRGRGAEPGNGPERNAVAAQDPPPSARATARGDNRPDGGRGYPRRTHLRTYPEDPTDKAIKLDLAPYHSLAPKLNDLQRRSDRISVEVIGQSTAGRDLYLVTLTAPESPAETRRQETWRDRIGNDPAAARRDPFLHTAYKAPIWINANIHGDEWEGTDGALRVIDHLATTSDRAALELLRRNRVHINLTANPDGRVAGTRSNAAGFDLNRDFVTASQPESRAMRDLVRRTQPLMVLDEHGYVEDTLIEPTTPPHGQNYDFDLYLKHGYEGALRMAEAVRALGHPEAAAPVIPFRDYEPGVWDGWAPIYTAQYSMYHGAVSYTVEVPMRVNHAEYVTLPVPELRRRSRINTDVVEATIRSTLDYVHRHRTSLLDNQIEMFRRGAAGEPQRHIPDGFVPGFGPEDRYTTEFPRAYVIPTGPDQRSGPAAARLVDHLVANDVRVQRAERPFTAAGRRYQAGSYVVDMRQPKRGMANVLLEAGRDLSDRVPVMYDISAWSHRLLWGASVDVVRDGPLDVRGRHVTAAYPTGAVDAAPGRDLALRLVDPKDVSAVNDLLGRGLPLHRQDDDTVVVPAAARSAAAEVADRHGVRFTAADAPGGTPMRRPVVAAAVAADELKALRDMGFEVHPVSTAALGAGFDWSRVDVLFVSSGLDLDQLTPGAKASLDAFLARGGGVVTRGATGARFNADAGVLPARAVAGKEDANGIVTVTDHAGRTGHSFVYAPLWFTDPGTGVTAEQRYGELVAGHWTTRADGSGGQDSAAGQAAVVSGTSPHGGKAVLFGTEPLFRDHPKGLYREVADALYRTAPVPARIPTSAPVPTG
ncbi:M14 family zinc carboxypeptidase [Saccharothrix australiensis]|uniref:Zinc carboxypeptidase n=1 Tax=Saccharothrix australiensis TaxID=2072 RepID=A0A495W611_9PSEU|nr:M14 family zinc carboxypeptidase [Saccharothrix australiensis]RKT57151.1 zinc carboxypeptidase [Saccharothrix australiensis]